jgi:hypothetical protein
MTVDMEASRESGQSWEAALFEAIKDLRRTNGDEAADRALAALYECVDFVRASGHGNVTLSVKDHKVAPQVRIEYFRNSMKGGPGQAR